MRVRSVRCAGDKRRQIASFNGRKAARVVRGNDLYLAYAIQETSAEDFECERISLLELVQTGEQLGLRESSMARDDRTSTRSSCRQGALRQMARSLSQRIFGGPVIDGKLESDLPDGERSHDSVS